jgi:hypothetical protein
MAYRTTDKRWWLLVAAIVIVLLIFGFRSFAYAQEAGEPILPVLSPNDDPLTLVIKVLIILVQLILIPFLLKWYAERSTRNIANKAEAEAARQAIEEKHARLLHSALNTASDIILDPNLSMDEKRTKGIAYVKKSVTDSVNHFAMSDTMILDMLTAYWNRKTMGTVVGTPEEGLALVNPPRTGFRS